MAATADPRANPPAAPSTHHLEPWAPQQQAPRAHRVRVPVHAAVDESGASADCDRRRSSSYSHRTSRGSGAEDLRGKLMGHLRDAADRLRVPQPSTTLPPPLPLTPPKAASPPPETEEPKPELKPPHEEEQQTQADVAEKPWKLRERKRRRPASLTSWPAAPSPKPSRRRKHAPFPVSLAHEEIEEDIYALTGGRPRQRPRKRPRAVQQKLDTVQVDGYESDDIVVTLTEQTLWKGYRVVSCSTDRLHATDI